MDGQNQIDRKLLGYIDGNRDRLVEHVRRMVHINSVEREARDGAPSGPDVKETLDQALPISREMGFGIADMNGYIGYAFHGRGGDYVCAMRHTDVVSAGEGWRESPFGGHIENGVIHGRGVLNNREPVIACLYGPAAVKLLGLTFRHPARIIFGCDEETGFEDLRYYLSREKPPVYGLAPDCRCPMVYSERGGAVVRIISTREYLGTFPGFVNEYFISAGNTDDRLGTDYYHEEYGMMKMRGYRLGLEPGGNTGYGNYTDMESLVSFDTALSYPGGIAVQDIMKPVTEKAEGYGLKTKLVQNYDPVVFAGNSPMVEAMQDSYGRVTGMDGAPIAATGGIYAKTMPEIVPFGPSFPGQKGISHNPNEWMAVDDLITNAKIYALALYHLAQL